MVAFFFPPPGRVVVDATATYVGTVSTGSDTNTPSFNGVAIGGENSSRVLCIYVSADDGGSIGSSAVLVDGVAATRVGINTNTNGDATGCWFWIAKPTGTTADISVTFGGSPTAIASAVSVYALYDVTTPPTANDATGTTGGGDSKTQTMTIPAGGLMLAAFSSDGSAPSVGPTGFTQRVNTTIQTDYVLIVGDEVTATELVGHEINWTSGSGDQRLCSVVWSRAS
jgi:uncharacterized Zn-binding protein involved in type VI secretion